MSRMGWEPGIGNGESAVQLSPCAQPGARYVTGLALAVVLMVCTTGVAAQERDASGWYAAPLFSYTRVDDARDTDDGVGVALAFGYRGGFARLELAAIHTPLGDGARLGGGQFAVLAGPFDEQRPLGRLYGIIGFGVLRRQNHPGFERDATTIFGDAGAGYMQPLRWLARGLQLRVEARYRHDVQQPPHDDAGPRRFGDVVVNAGLHVPLMRGARATAAARDQDVSVVPATE
jgi:hypothetical protein